MNNHLMVKETTVQQLRTGDDYCSRNQKILVTYNAHLEEEAKLTRLNEAFLEQRLTELEQSCPSHDELFWLTAARIEELTLFCAGNYADNLEFSSAGDLLINPRLVLVHLDKQSVPVPKERHTSLEDQFRHVATTKSGALAWLRDHTLVEVKKEPLLPYLKNMLRNSGCIASEYLESINGRMKRIADTLGFFAVQQISSRAELEQQLRTLPAQDRELFSGYLCRLDMILFYELGNDFYQMVQNPYYRSRFLSGQQSSEIQERLPTLSQRDSMTILYSNVDTIVT
ncbi:MAG TPA: hypothetical protein PLG17_08715 [Thermodesulfobacteriota bacterium]|nr:hypothetical protein [Thermodesulfobacteriota bacterium]